LELSEILGTSAVLSASSPSGRIHSKHSRFEDVLWSLSRTALVVTIVLEAAHAIQRGYY